MKILRLTLLFVISPLSLWIASRFLTRRLSFRLPLFFAGMTGLTWLAFEVMKPVDWEGLFIFFVMALEIWVVAWTEALLFLKSRPKSRRKTALTAGAAIALIAPFGMILIEFVVPKLLHNLARQSYLESLKTPPSARPE